MNLLPQKAGVRMVDVRAARLYYVPPGGHTDPLLQRCIFGVKTTDGPQYGKIWKLEAWDFRTLDYWCTCPDCGCPFGIKEWEKIYWMVGIPVFFCEECSRKEGFIW